MPVPYICFVVHFSYIGYYHWSRSSFQLLTFWTQPGFQLEITTLVQPHNGRLGKILPPLVYSINKKSCGWFAFFSWVLLPTALSCSLVPFVFIFFLCINHSRSRPIAITNSAHGILSTKIIKFYIIILFKSDNTTVLSAYFYFSFTMIILFFINIKIIRFF